MTEINLEIITQITVEIHKSGTNKEKLGTGVLYTNKSLLGNVYVLTAKHCLERLTDDETVSLRVFNSISRTYEYITPNKQKILLHPKDDAGIIMFNKREIAKVIPYFPNLYIIDKYVNIDDCFTKGFPIATFDQTSDCGESSLVALKMSYLQELTNENVFQFSTTEDYSADTIIGMSGAGIFVEACEELYINGIFTRFSDEDRGKVIYAQGLSSYNDLLESEFKKKIPPTYLGYCGLGHKTFQTNVEESIANLGPRYSQRVNVKTGTAKYVESVAKTSFFYERLYQTIDSWLTEKSYATREKSARIGSLEIKLKEIRDRFAIELKNLDKSVDAVIDFSHLMKQIDDFKIELDTTRDKLYSEKNETNNEQLRHEIVDELSRIYRISQDLDSFNDGYEDLSIKVVNHPYLIINGEAGSGKSHLLGDVAKNRIDEGLPTLFFLGTDFVNGTYETIITSKIGFNGTFHELLFSLNQIGYQVGSRTLLMIDALNEGIQSNLWKDRLAGLIQSLKEYPAVGLVVSVRDTYFTNVIPDDVENMCHATVIKHNGFKGLEYEAVQQFCLSYKLNLPNVPLLTPEFCNPLFLKIICDTLESTCEKNFPKGFNGVSNLFNKYFKILDKKFSDFDKVYKYRDVVTTSIKLLAIPIFEAEYNLLRRQEADRILQQNFPSCTTLLTDLIDNNVLLLTKSQFDRDNEDFVVFSYQRISDFIIAKELIERYPNWESFVNNINTDVYLKKIIIQEQWLNRGIKEALAILIPEVYGHEITEVVEYIQGEKRCKEDWYYDSMLYSLVNSLNWRSIESINKDKIRDILKSKIHQFRIEEWYNKLAELSTISKHPFNADYFHDIMINMSMPDRDELLQSFFNQCAGFDDYKCAYPLRRMIDWAWSEEVSQKTDYESARLAAIMLCWLLSSTHIRFRDEATKALVNLLSEKVDVLINVMRSFKGVDDMYIYERIFAVAYGVALRTSSSKGLSDLAKYIYTIIFKLNNPPKNILLRDYARNIIEYAKYKVGVTSINMVKVRPPYLSELPSWPTDNEIDCFHIDYDEQHFKERRGAEQNMIWESIKGDLPDFWNKIVSPIIERFYPILISEEKAHKQAMLLFKREMKENIKVYVEAKAKSICNESYKKDRYFDFVLKQGEKILEESLTEEQLKAINEIMIPLKIKEITFKNNHYSRFPTDGVRNWLVKRAYELGFDVNKHGEYDSFAKNWTFRHPDDRIDRIGKKYQWIAFYEIMGILSDNYKYKTIDGYGGYGLFNGAWQSYIRNINPSMIIREKIIKQELLDVNNKSEWYNEDEFNNWRYNYSDDIWASMINDIPDPIYMIQKNDDNGEEWLALDNQKNWDEPKEIGKEVYSSKTIRHYLYMSVEALIVKQQDVENMVKHLEGKNLWTHFDYYPDYSHHLLNREKYWSPAYKDECKNNKEWLCFDELKVEYIYAFEKACAHIEADKSGTINQYGIPCRMLFEGMEMKYDAKDGQYIDENGNLLAVTYGNEQILVKKDVLLSFLSKNSLSILWLVKGEKRVYMTGGLGCMYEYMPCGVYYLDENNNPNGILKTYKRV